MGAIKNAMKKILPPPVSAFNREVERLLEAQEKSAQLVAQLSLQLEEQKRQIAHLEAQVEKCASLSASIQWKQTKTLEKVERVRKTVSQVHGSVENYQYYANLSPEAYRSELQEWFFDLMGRKLNLDNPKTYNEKIQWLKLYDSTPLKTRLADKYLVRDWVKEKIGEQYLVPLLGVWDSFDEIDFDALPQRFVLKANHGCGWNLIVKDKSQLDLEDAREKFNTWMGLNYAFCNGFELHYMNIPPKIIAEEYLENNDQDLYDYKVFCFAGKALHVMHVTDRSVGRKMTFYDTQWQMQTFAQGSLIGHEAAPRPQRLEELIEVAEKLAQGFAHARVDFYVLNDGTLKFGELTFTPASGTCQWNPPQLYGDLIVLPEKSPVPVLKP
ncbi:ATP-grasp fold amidoligase family protein [Pseudoflavonifractor sp. An85]|uniref:ATP-grasp fold amidoligase family protein n=1 Tax=Pseudoflavonifractor sp. An85 TaxID=1965661 RepID=UPI000B39B81C|nr:ATP-grasp fold amidoligase family protein [Pseudoflavonifractor sp. An85]OUN25713.1 hypothetical protein B5G37_02565 [Pseudoflavonifractor sp. An85]